MKLLLIFLLLLPPIAAADMDKICAIYTESYGWDDISRGIEEQGCVSNNILQVVYGVDNPQENMLLLQAGHWCRFDRNIDIRGNALSCVLYSNKPRNRIGISSRE